MTLHPSFTLAGGGIPQAYNDLATGNRRLEQASHKNFVKTSRFLIFYIHFLRFYLWNLTIRAGQCQKCMRKLHILIKNIKNTYHLVTVMTTGGLRLSSFTIVNDVTVVPMCIWLIAYGVPGARAAKSSKICQNQSVFDDFR